MEQGDIVEVKAQQEGVLVVRKIPSLKTVQEKIREKKLPQWSELEGKADRLIEMESKRKKMRSKEE